MAKEEQGQFSFDTVAALVGAMLANGQSIGTSTYEAMSALDGKRSANAFAHQFRAVIRRAKELREQQADGELQPATPKPRVKSENKKGISHPVKTPKRGAADISDVGSDGDNDGSPSKKIKAGAVEEIVGHDL